MAGLMMTLISACGCVGIYGNTKRFLNPPTAGMKEIDMIKAYGEPSFATEIEDQKVYTYSVRDVRYIVVVGLYKGYDLVVVCRDGYVIEVKKISRNDSLALFQPVPWVVPE